MASNSALKCPACNQENTPDMAFCIFCGAGMRGASSGRLGTSSSFAAAATNFSAEQNEDDSGINICPKCNSADPLSKEYCIICGTRLFKRERSKGITSSVMVQSELLSLKEDISTIQAVSAQAAKPVRVPAFVGFLCLALLGLGLGVAAGTVDIQKTDNPTPLSLPKEGLALLTAKPFCDMLIELPNHRDFLVGRTGSTGDIALEYLVSGSYQIELTASDGSSLYSSPATIRTGSATILGGPPGPELLAKSAAATN